ncbi:unnamed protein product, partial [Iphiclides podalirius]
MKNSKISACIHQDFICRGAVSPEVLSTGARGSPLGVSGRRAGEEVRGAGGRGGRPRREAHERSARHPPYAYCMEIYNWPSYSSFDELRDRSIMSGAAGAAALGRH